MADTGIIYCVTRRATGQRYVGLTTFPLWERWTGHVAECGRLTSKFAAAIRADGRDGFDLATLEADVPVDLLPARERHWIAALDTFANGLNGNRGGSSPRRQREGLLRQAEQVAKDRGVCLNTARRWVREGRVRDAARAYSRNGATGTDLFKRWHGLRRRGGSVSDQWRHFERFVADVAKAGYEPSLRIQRISRSEPWGPNNFRLVAGWRTSSPNST